MPSLRQKWRKTLSAMAKRPWPDDLGCIVADGRTYRRSELITLINEGSEAWNALRRTFPPIQWHRTKSGEWWTPGFMLRLSNCDFRRLDLSYMDLTGCDFAHSNFSRAKFIGTRIGPTGPHGSFERRGDFSGCVFRGMEAVSVDFGGCNMSKCDFTGAELNGVELGRTYMRHARFSKCMLAARFSDTNVHGADFSNAYLFATEFINTDLSGASNLSKANFYDHSIVDHRTLFRSGPLPDLFYRGCDFPDILVQFMPSLIQSPIQIESCFISHSSRDKRFVSHLYRDLQEARVRCFYAQRDLKVGSVTRDALDSAVQANDRLLLVLSVDSISSQWVEHEVEAALEKERNERRLVLFPIMIDSSVMSSKKGWVANLRRQRSIGDFTRWADTAEYEIAFRRLLDDLTKVRSSNGN
jgi:hypothetical protein